MPVLLPDLWAWIDRTDDWCLPFCLNNDDSWWRCYICQTCPRFYYGFTHYLPILHLPDFLDAYEYRKDPFQNIKMMTIVANTNGRHQMIMNIIEIVDISMKIINNFFLNVSINVKFYKWLYKFFYIDYLNNKFLS